MKKTILIIFITSCCLNAYAGAQFDRMDTNRDKQVTEAEFLASWQKNFMRLDKNKDNVLQASEWKAPGKAWDPDGNGVTLKEWETIRKRHFKVSDKNENGVLEPSEFPK